MEHRKGPCLTALLVGALLCSLALAETRKEAATGIEFASVASDGLVLVGVGVRKKLVFNVYAAALYVDAVALKEAVGEEGVAGVNQVVHKSGIKRRMILHFVRDVPAEKIRTAFRNSLESNMSAQDYAVEAGRVDRFLDSCTDVKEGDLFVFESNGDFVKVALRGQTIFKAGSRRLMRGMWGSYFGKRPINEALRKGLLKGSGQLLGSP